MTTITPSSPSLFLAILAFRLVNALSLRTFFQPDEYFQALEPAWRLAFGPDAGAWITWEWHHAIRSSIHPALFAASYRAADALSHLAPALRPTALLVAPKVLQAVSAAVSDWATWSLARRVHGDASPAAYAAAALSLTSPWQWYCSTRTFSNSLETALTALALSLFPWSLLSPPEPTKENPKAPPPFSPLNLRLSLLLAALAILLRPTNIFIWTPIAALVLPHVLPSFRLTLVLAREAVLCGAAVLALSLGLDRVYFARWTFPPYNWLHFNLFSALAAFYGTSGWHYYLSQALPILCAASLPFVLVALWRPTASVTNTTTDIQQKQKKNTLNTLAAAVYTNIAVLSLVSHKEWRFIYPPLPILNVLAAPCAASFFTTTTTTTTTTTPRTSSFKLRNKPYLITALAINAAIAIFLSTLHQPAVISVLAFIRDEYARQNPALATLSPSSPVHHHHHHLSHDDIINNNNNNLFVLFLTPCHSTPWRSHLVYPALSARALTCEPPLHTAPGSRERAEYKPEDDRFHDDPQGFLDHELRGIPYTLEDTPIPTDAPLSIPQYIVGFEGIEPWITEFFEQGPGKTMGARLEKVWEGWNGFFTDDDRREGKLIVWSTGQGGD